MRVLVLVVAALQILVSSSVGVNADCTLGNEDLEENEPFESPGLYIDLENPAPCSGELTRWHYCYYEPEPTRLTLYTVQLGVWRFSRQDNSYRKVGEVEFRRIVLRRQDDFECDDIRLQSNEYMEIKKGDYLGMILGTRTLPMATEGTGSQVFLATDVTNMETQTVADSAGNIRELALHIWAEIVGDDVPAETTASPAPITTTKSPTTQLPQPLTTTSNDPEISTTAEVLSESTTKPTDKNKDTTQSSTVSSVGFDISLTDSLERDDASGLGVETIVGIVIAALFALVFLSVLISVIIVYHKKRRSKDTRMSAASNGQNGRQGSSKDATIFSGGAAMDYETPKNGNDLKQSHPQSAKQQKWKSTHSNRSNATGEHSWFHDSFETDSAYNVRYATHAEVSNAAIYEPVPDAMSNSGENDGEDIYEDIDSMDITSLPAKTTLDDSMANRTSELYECPTDAMEYANIQSTAPDFNIYDDTM